jgi:hypothetical protein
MRDHRKARFEAITAEIEDYRRSIEGMRAGLFKIMHHRLGDVPRDMTNDSIAHSERIIATLEAVLAEHYAEFLALAPDRDEGKRPDELDASNDD